MAENDKASEPGTVAPPAPDGTPPVPPKRSPGHRGADVKDTVAEMAAKAHEISLEAGSKMSAAMKDVVNAAAGLTGFVMESARDLVQFMVRRGQMTQEEADKLIRQVEEHQPKRPKPAAPPPKAEPVRHVAAASSPAAVSATTPKLVAKPAVVQHVAPAKKVASTPVKPVKPLKPAKTATPPKAVKKAAGKPAPKKAAPKKAAPKKPVAKKPAPKKAAPKKPAPKKPAPKKAAKAKRK